MHTHRRRSIAGLTGLALSVLVVMLIAPVYAQAPSISLSDAKKMLAAAEAAAAKVPVALSCTVVDARADLVAMARMDGARYFTVNVSHGKARASAAFGGPSGGLSQLAGSGIGAAVGDPVFFLQGAIPLMKNKQLAGAIGCSGGTGQQDEDAAKAGAAAL